MRAPPEQDFVCYFGLGGLVLLPASGLGVVVLLPELGLGVTLPGLLVPLAPVLPLPLAGQEPFPRAICTTCMVCGALLLALLLAPGPEAFALAEPESDAAPLIVPATFTDSPICLVSVGSASFGMSSL